MSEFVFIQRATIELLNQLLKDFKPGGDDGSLDQDSVVERKELGVFGGYLEVKWKRIW